MASEAYAVRHQAMGASFGLARTTVLVTMDEKHHLVPEFYLRGFADGEQIALTDRDLRRQFATSVKRALKVGGFYNLSQEPIQQLSKMDSVQRERYLADLAVMEQIPGLSSKIIELNGDVVRVLPGAIEALLSFLEGRGESALHRVRESFPDISGDDRLWAAHFVALQFSRGQALRTHVSDAMKLAFLEMLRGSPQMRKDWERQTGRPVEEAEAELAGITIGGDPVFAFMFDVFKETVPFFLAMRWRVLEFEPGSVLTSDEPVGLWGRPGRDLEASPLGIATADAIYFPLDSGLILQLLSPDSSAVEERRPGSQAKLRHSNATVASAARRWIVFQPGSSALDGLRVQRLPRLHLEKVGARLANDGTYRELMRLSSR
jgi:hypothetical protein